MGEEWKRMREEKRQHNKEGDRKKKEERTLKLCYSMSVSLGEGLMIHWNIAA